MHGIASPLKLRRQGTDGSLIAPIQSSASIAPYVVKCYQQEATKQRIGQLNQQNINDRTVNETSRSQTTHLCI